MRSQILTGGHLVQKGLEARPHRLNLGGLYSAQPKSHQPWLGRYESHAPRQKRQYNPARGHSLQGFERRPGVWRSRQHPDHFVAKRLNAWRVCVGHAALLRIACNTQYFGRRRRFVKRTFLAAVGLCPPASDGGQPTVMLPHQDGDHYASCICSSSAIALSVFPKSSAATLSGILAICSIFLSAGMMSHTASRAGTSTAVTL